MTSPRLTVAMSVYNNAPYLAEAIDSILGQSFTEFEFLIVNDGSTDGSGALIDARAAADPRIRVIHQENCGFIASLNLMFAEARTPWVARMDGDDVSLPGRLEKQWAAAMADDRLGLVGCQADIIDGAGKSLGPGHHKPLTHEECLDALEDRPLVNHNAVLLRRDAVLAAGGYRAAFRHAEDYDLWTRLIGMVRFVNLPEALVAYRIYPDQVSSRHMVEQRANAAIAWQAYLERLAGRTDPTDGLATMPPPEQLDLLFGRAGVAAYVRRTVAERILYSSEALAGSGYRLMLDHIAEAGGNAQMWRASARLLRAGHPVKAAGLASALLRAG
jgi:glycosyltransferase involved in cell wall biosynthesis